RPRPRPPPPCGLRVGSAYLGLQQTGLEQHQRLPPKLMYQLPQAHADVLVAIGLLVEGAPRLLIRQALLEPLEDVDVGELALGEPGLGDYAQPLPQHAE